MRLATVRTRPGATVAVRLDDDRPVALDAPDVARVLARGRDTVAVDRTASTRLPADPSDLDLAPVVAPHKSVFVGLNYRDHIQEMGRDLPAHPTLFTKWSDAFIGPYDDLVLAPGSEHWDHEVELGVVIGRRVPRAASREEAIVAIAGYTIVNDVTARDWQRRTTQFLQGKSWYASTPVGPWLVTADELDPDGTGCPDLAVSLDVDGERRQSGHTGDLVFDPATLVSYLSQMTALGPGDLVATGTPGGVAAAMDPPGWLHPGNVVTATIEGIGSCRTGCRTPTNGP